MVVCIQEPVVVDRHRSGAYLRPWSVLFYVIVVVVLDD